MPPPSPRFDYAGLDAETRAQVLAEVQAIHRENADNIAGKLSLGQRLLTLQRLVGRFDFQPLVKAEYGWCRSTTTNYTNVASIFPDLDAICRANIHWTALLTLARDGVSPDARAEALRLARAGTIVTKILAEDLVAGADDSSEDARFDRLLAQAGRNWKRTVQFMTALAVLRREIPAPNRELVAAMFLDGRQFFGSLPADIDCPADPSVDARVEELVRVPPVIAEIPRVQTCGVSVPPASVAELVRVPPATPTRSASEGTISTTSPAPIEPEPAPAVAELARVQTISEIAPISSAVFQESFDAAPATNHPTASPQNAPDARGKPVPRSRRGFLATVGSLFGAAFLAHVPAAHVRAAVSIAGSADPPASSAPPPPAAEHVSGRVTVYKHNAEGNLVSITEGPNYPSTAQPTSSHSAHDQT